MLKKYSHKALFQRSGFDRRSADTRRTLHDLDYLDGVGEERRSGRDRRSSGELRQDWIRYSAWCSVYVGDSNS